MPNTKPTAAETQFASLSTRFTLAGLAATAALAAVPVAAEAGGYTPPASLSPGDHYRLVFVTSTTIDATSADIATYNSFVTSAAALNASLPTTIWKAIASTASVNAIDNIACTPSCASDPIFLVEGTKVARSSDDFWAGVMMYAIQLTESGSSTVPTLNTGPYVWTGTTSDGTASAALGSADALVGNHTYTNTVFVDAYGLKILNTFTGPLYAISGELTVPDADVPEPAALSLLASGGLLTFLSRRLRRQRRASV